MQPTPMQPVPMHPLRLMRPFDPSGGGGSFRLNQPCDKTIMLWVDDLSETADEECNENGQAQICSCTAEMAVLMDMIVELKAELDTLKDEFAAQEDD